jgi:hypothetical protein
MYRLCILQMNDAPDEFAQQKKRKTEAALHLSIEVVRIT